MWTSQRFHHLARLQIIQTYSTWILVFIPFLFLLISSLLLLLELKTWNRINDRPDLFRRWNWVSVLVDLLLSPRLSLLIVVAHRSHLHILPWPDDILELPHAIVVIELPSVAIGLELETVLTRLLVNLPINVHLNCRVLLDLTHDILHVVHDRSDVYNVSSHIDRLRVLSIICLSVERIHVDVNTRLVSILLLLLLLLLSLCYPFEVAQILTEIPNVLHSVHEIPLLFSILGIAHLLLILHLLITVQELLLLLSPIVSLRTVHLNSLGSILLFFCLG